MTTGIHNSVSFASNVAFVESLTTATAGSASLVTLLAITQFLHQVKIKFILQLINGISTVLQKLPICFNLTF